MIAEYTSDILLVGISYDKETTHKATFIEGEIAVVVKKRMSIHSIVLLFDILLGMVTLNEGTSRSKTQKKGRAIDPSILLNLINHTY